MGGGGGGGVLIHELCKFLVGGAHHDTQHCATGMVLGADHVHFGDLAMMI